MVSCVYISVVAVGGSAVPGRARGGRVGTAEGACMGRVDPLIC